MEKETNGGKMIEGEFEAKFEACLIKADKWWENLEDEEKVTFYLRQEKS